MLIAEENSILRKKFSEIINEHAKLHVFDQVASIEKLRDAVKEADYDVVVVGNSVAGGTSIEAIEAVLKIKGLPILYAPLINPNSNITEYPKILDLGFIETVQILTNLNYKNMEILKLPRLIAIKCTILAKLNMKRFAFQYELYLNNEFKQIFVKRSDNRKAKDIAPDLSRRKIARKIKSDKGTFTSRDVIVIGASTGGPKTLIDLISQFPASFPPVLVVQHMPQGFISSFAERLNRKSKMKVKMAETGDLITKGNIYVAQGGYHMEIYLDADKNALIQITDGPTVNFVKPSVDVTLFSAARVWGRGVISVILTGMGHDGSQGTKTIKKLGGKCIAQSAVDSVIYGMNKSVIEAGLADKVLRIDEIAVELAMMLGFKVSE